MARAQGLQPRTAVEGIKVVGLRRRIAEKMSISNSRIPHITYVEEVDVTGLEELRATLNNQKRHDQPKLTLLPFLMRAMVLAIVEQPNLNALFDDEAGVVPACRRAMASRRRRPRASWCRWSGTQSARPLGLWG
jgi:2-oxoisovalerate dehydrogenase E2 component (dihydrolipoyl transacylase)